MLYTYHQPGFKNGHLFFFSKVLKANVYNIKEDISVENVFESLVSIALL